MTGEPADTFTLDVSIETPESVATHLDRAAELRARSREAQSEAAAELRQAARELREAGMPLRDIGILLDVSYQRAHQLVS